MSTVFNEQSDLGELDLEDRHALRRVAGLSTELQDISEVEYRALRLERVVLIGVWAEGSLASAENSLRELSRLAETAGSEVLEALLVPSGEMDRCVSPFGVHDMAGNIDEWTVNVSGHGKPFVSYLKGGHSLGVRNASRPATEAHGPEFAWWETGTRACLDVAR